MTRISDKVFELAHALYAFDDTDLADANLIRYMVKELESENDRLRADLREAVTTLHTLRLGVANSIPGYGTYETCEADFQNLRQRMDEAAKLLEKHKETQ